MTSLATFALFPHRDRPAIHGLTRSPAAWGLGLALTFVEQNRPPVKTCAACDARFTLSGPAGRRPDASTMAWTSHNLNEEWRIAFASFRSTSLMSRFNRRPAVVDGRTMLTREIATHA